MKKNVLSAMFLLMVSLAIKAQTEKGSWLVGGNIGLNTAKNKTEVALMPMAGYFFTKNFVAGANTKLSYTKDVENKTTILGVGPFARYYLGTMNIRPFADAELIFESNKVKTPNTSSTLNSRSFFLGAGLAAFINRNVAVEGLAGYKRTRFEGGPGTGGFNLRIGFQVYISREQMERRSR
jgi:hypothetical protein